ncbi:hypothetical protein GGD57_001737 [Rhizobium esperanzae]|uniref:Uncharacterized protein n=1 Tax=Rhizobium esperanzae TaxID=1967781 RepID=A0A7W6R1N7_9HYPH|nr:hypothetical protein [Rhizobium esperanzae]
MGDEARPLDRKDEIVGRLVAPAAEAFGPLQAIEGAVDLDRREVPGGVGKLLLLRQVLRIELAAPGGLKRVAIFQIRFSCFRSLFLRMSLSQNRCTLLRDML